MLFPKTVTRAQNAVTTRILGLWAPFPPACFFKKMVSTASKIQLLLHCSFV
jgi:hypothetical protein